MLCAAGELCLVPARTPERPAATNVVENAVVDCTDCVVTPIRTVTTHAARLP